MKGTCLLFEEARELVREAGGASSICSHLELG